MLVNVAQQCRKVFTGILLVVGITFLVWNQALSDSKSTSRLIGQKTQTQNEENVNSSKVPTQLPWWDRKKLLDCNNSEQRRDSELMMKTDKKFSYTGFTSHCGARASSYGNGQQVITYTLFGDKDAYTVGLPSILHDASVLYKGWLVRLHTDPRTRCVPEYLNMTKYIFIILFKNQFHSVILHHGAKNMFDDKSLFRLPQIRPIVPAASEIPSVLRVRCTKLATSTRRRDSCR